MTGIKALNFTSSGTTTNAVAWGFNFASNQEGFYDFSVGAFTYTLIHKMLGFRLNQSGVLFNDDTLKRLGPYEKLMKIGGIQRKYPNW